MLAVRRAGVWVKQARPLTEQQAMVSRERGSEARVPGLKRATKEKEPGARKDRASAEPCRLCVWKQPRAEQRGRGGCAGGGKKEEDQPVQERRRSAVRDPSGKVKVVLDDSPVRRSLQLFHGGSGARLHRAIRPANRRWYRVKAPVRGLAEAGRIFCALRHERDLVR